MAADPDTAHPAAQRLHGLDRVRVMAIVAVFLFHCARYFDHQDWHVKNPETSDTLSLFVRFVAIWIMPLFFFISGVSARLSLERGTAQYIHSRVKRLLVPFAFGTLVLLAPLQVWVERVTHGGFSGGFLDFYPHYFSGWYGFGGNFAWMGLHLWYLQMLFLFSFMTLPLFLKMNRMPGNDTPSRLLTFGPLPVVILPVIAAEIVSSLDPGLLGRRDWGGWPLLSHLAFFFGGYYTALRISIPEYFAARFPHHLVAAVSFTAILLVLDIAVVPGTMARNLAFSAALPVTSMLWISALIGLGFRTLNEPGRWLSYANEAVLPFYILHQTVIVLIGYVLMDMGMGIAATYALLSGSSFIIILILYEGIVRRSTVTRFCFGMKPAGTGR